MRNLLFASLGCLVACEAGPGNIKEPPVLTITSPERSTVQGVGGQITVTGTVTPSASGAAIDQVLVNSVATSVQPDGSFHAVIDVAPGAALIHTVARDVDGITASDTRSIQTGALHPVGANIDRAVAAALSADAFAKISAAAGPIIKGLDMPAMLGPLNPMVNVGDEWANLKLFVDNLELSDIKISLAPVAGGLQFTAEITHLDVPSRIQYAGRLVPDGSMSVRVTADKITVAGTLEVTPAGMAGFKTTLASPDVGITNSHLDATGLPGAILDIFDLDGAIAFIASKAAELAMGPLVNQALGALGGPQQLDVLGHTLDLQVAPSVVEFTPAGGLVELNMKALLAGSESSPGFILTENGTPAMDTAQGFQIGLADDLVNELLAELHALGTLNLSMPQDVGVFDTVNVKLTVPPMISADAADGQMRLVLGDMFATFTSHGTPVGKAAINARIDLKIAPATGGGSVALQLGPPEIHVDTLDDIANTTGLKDVDLAKATAACLGAQIDAISKLLVSIPVPALAGLQFRDLAIGADDGYVVISGQL